MSIRGVLTVLAVFVAGYVTLALGLFVGLVRLLSRQIHPEED
jgi:hypothetical protein